MKCEMNRFPVWVFLMFGLWGGLAPLCRAQQRPLSGIQGHVQNQQQQSLPGVNLWIAALEKGASTDMDGNFSFSMLPEGKHTLQVTCMGYQPRELSIEVKNGEVATSTIILTEEVFAMNDLVVAGKSSTRRVIEQAYQVSSVSADALLNSSTDVKAVLNRVSGVRIQEDGGMGSDMTFTLNGFSGDQVKFFMDGIPMDNFGAGMSLNNIPVNMIEQVDVYKGVVPVWLGTDALGGAINIVTNKKANFLDASYALGSFNTHRASVNTAHTNQNNGFTVRGNAFYNYSDNDYRVLAEIYENNTLVGEEWVHRFHDRYQSGMVKLETGFVGRTFADNLLLGFMASANDEQVQTGATMYTVYGGIKKDSRSFIPTLRYRKKDVLTEGLDVSLYSALTYNQAHVIDTLQGVYFNWRGDKFYKYTSNNELSTDGEYLRTFTTFNEREFTNQLNVGYALGARSSLALNYAYNYFSREASDALNPDKVDNQFPKRLQKNILGLAYKFDFHTRWSTTAFTKLYLLDTKTSMEVDFALETQRIEAYHNFQHSMGYGLASSWFAFPQLQLKLSYEHTYRMPTPEEIFGDGLFVQANAELGPEQSDNLNVGAEYLKRVSGNHQLSVGGSLIYREAKDLIYTVVTVSSPQTYYDNLSKTRVLGVEGNFRYQFRKAFHAGGSITYQSLTDRARYVYNESYTGSGWQKNYHFGYRLPNKPYFFANANTGYTCRWSALKTSTLSINYYFNFVEKYFLTWTPNTSSNDKYVIPRQFSHDAEISYSIYKGTYNIAIECRNLMDALLYDKYYLQKPGRYFGVKLRYAM